MAFVDEVVNGEQLDGGDPELLEVIDAGFAGQAGVGAAEMFGDHGVLHGVAADVDLVDDRVGERGIGRAIACPVEVAVDHDGFGDAVGGVLVVALEVIAAGDVVGEDGGLPVDVASDGLGVGVDEELGRVEAVALFRLPRAVDAIAVALAGLDVADETVPDVGGALVQGDAVSLVALFVKEADRDAGGVLRIQGEVGSLGAGCGAQGIGASGEQGSFHGSACASVKVFLVGWWSRKTLATIV